MKKVQCSQLKKNVFEKPYLDFEMPYNGIPTKYPATIYPEKIPRRQNTPNQKYPGDKIPRTKNTPATIYPEPKIPRDKMPRFLKKIIVELRVFENCNEIYLYLINVLCVLH